MAKRKSKRKKGKVIQMNAPLSPPKYIVKHARKLPVILTKVSTSIVEDGIGYVFIARQKQNEDVVFGVYLIDMWCLGLKDTFFHIKTKWEFKEILDEYEQVINLIDVDPTYAYNLVYGSIEYAEDIGFQPHKDFSISEFILPNVESIEYMEIEFGVEGKPYYTEGPNDQPKKILAHLENTLGAENYGFSTNEEDSSADDILEDHNPFDEGPDEEFKTQTLETINSTFYRERLMIIDEILNLYERDFELLQSEYINDADLTCSKILKLCDGDLLKDLGDQKLISMIKPLAENLIIFKNEDYLFIDAHVIAFMKDVRPEYEISAGLVRTSLTKHGYEKLETICMKILQLYSQAMNNSSKEFLKELITDFKQDEEHDLLVPHDEIVALQVHTGLTAIKLHTDVFGPIDFDKINITDEL